MLSSDARTNKETLGSDLVRPRYWYWYLYWNWNWIIGIGLGLGIYIGIGIGIGGREGGDLET